MSHVTPCHMLHVTCHVSFSYLLYAHEKEAKQLKTNFLDIYIEVQKQDVKKSYPIEKDLNMEAKMEYEGKRHDEVLKHEKL